MTLLLTLLLVPACKSGPSETPDIGAVLDSGQAETNGSDSDTTGASDGDAALDTDTSADPEPPQLRYWVWNLPLEGELILQDGVRPYLRVRVESSGSMDAPEGFVADANWTDQQRMAEVYAAWIQAYQSVEPFASGTTLEYSLFPQNLGHEKWSSRPFFIHPQDQMDEEINEHKFGNPFTLHGRAAVRAYSEDLVAAITTRLSQDGLSAPTRLHLDMESAPSISEAIAVEAESPVGWWSLAQGDERFDSEAVVDDFTLSKLYTTAVSVDGAPPAPNYAIGTWSAANGPFLGWLSSLNIRLKDFVLRDAFLAPALAQWPEALTSNYAVTCATPEYHPRRGKVFIKSIDVPSIGLDFQSPVLYPASSNAYGEAGTHLNDHLVSLGLPETASHSPETFSQLYRKRAKQMIDAALAACPSKPLAPWIGYPGYRQPIPGFRLGPGQGDSCYQVTDEDLVDIMQYGVGKGVREWLLWTNANAGDPCTELEIDPVMPLTPEQIWAQWAKVVAEINKFDQPEQ